MRISHCPLCYGELETREVTPCMECGGEPIELQHLAEGRHTYAELRVFGELALVLCDFCQVDFGSRDPAFFGLPRHARIGFDKMQFLRDVPATPGHDKYCPDCGLRLAFLKFVVAARERHARTP